MALKTHPRNENDQNDFDHNDHFDQNDHFDSVFSELFFTTYGYVFMWKINKKNVKKEILNSFSYDMNTRISLKMRTFAPELERIRWNH